MSATDTHDFEIVARPDGVMNDPPLENDATDTTDKRSIRDLFDTPDEPSIFQVLAKIIVLASLPIGIAWTTLFALVSTAYLSKTDDDFLSEEDILPHVSQYIQYIMEWYRQGLVWIDSQLPQFLERQKMAFAHQKNVAAEKFTREFGRHKHSYVNTNSVRRRTPTMTSRRNLRRILVATTLIPVLCVFTVGCPMFLWNMRVPMWMWLGLGDWYSKRQRGAQAAIFKPGAT